MGSLFRSEEMTLCQLFLQQEAAYACVSELGELGLVQFRDLNPNVNAFQRKFVNEVRRCDEMERKLRFLEKEIKKDGIPILDSGDKPEAPAPKEMIDLEATFEKLENELKEVNANAEALNKNYLELTELKHILRKTQHFFDEAFHHMVEHDEEQYHTDESVALLGDESRVTHHSEPRAMSFVAGVIHRERIPAFERMLWRVCRGNVFLRQAEIEVALDDPVTGDKVNKSVFIIFFQGEQLKTRVKKICEGFRAMLYPCPETPAERREMALGVMTRLEDLNTVLGQTRDHRHRVLVAAARNVQVWFIKVKKIKAIYHTLNQCSDDVTQKCLIAECWGPVLDLDKIQLALKRGTEKSGSTVPSILNRMTTHQEPPTYHRTNKFTEGFQNIIDAYGIARYREVNPAPYSIITFPFLFAIMFGDLGHGFLMMLFALWMIWKEKQIQAEKSDNEIFNTFFNGRYIIMLMGTFSLYTGIIYNELFSKSFKIFPTAWTVVYDLDTMFDSDYNTLDPADNQTYGGNPYPVGMDPIWNMAENKITFLDSFKMKLSVILGITHMTFGVILSIYNHRYYRQAINIFCEFIPQMIFMLTIFGYLVVLIFYKWVAYSPSDSENAPSILIGFIDMFLFKDTSSYSYLQLFTDLSGLSTFLVVVAYLCIPWMLFLKPYILYRRNKYGSEPKNFVGSINHGEGGAGGPGGEVVHNEDGEVNHPLNGDATGGAGGGQTAADHEEFDMVETFVHSCIHTIEYCLGCVSNTASYLRLWALSLAHSQLSEVLWEMVLRIGLKQDSYIGAIILSALFAFWAVLTVGVLLLMEGLSAFLHALRLHWVEFMTKFYGGTGYLFQPFSFDVILDPNHEE